MFKISLHSALFMPGSNGSGQLEGYSETTEQKTEVTEKKEVVETSEKQQDELTNDIERAYFDNPEANFVEQKNKEASSAEQSEYQSYRVKLSNFVKRYTENKDWNARIKDGYTKLMQTLEQNKYFDGKSDEKIKSEKRSIFAKYTKKINRILEKEVRDASEEEYNNKKGSLFTEGSDTYPANDLYKSLTGAEIYDRKHQDRSAYDVVSTGERVQEGSETLKDVSYRRFLGYDLPNYLWEIKGSKSSANWRKAIQWVPFISVSADKPSDIDKKGIEDFVDVVMDIANAYKGNTDAIKKIESSLFSVFDDAKTNWTTQMWKSALESKGYTNLSDKLVRHIQKAGQFYLECQTEGTSNSQHNIYLSVMQIIKRTGSCDAAVREFYSEVKAAKDNKESKSERKEDKNGEALLKMSEGSKMKALADKLGISDYTAATNLMRIVSDTTKSDYFSKKSETEIIADLNNDGTLTFADDGVTKTGLQFKQIMDSLSQEEQGKAWNRLIEHANLLNKTMGLNVKNTPITKEDIKAGNPGVILLLQNIISQPGEDFYTMLKYGPETRNEKMQEMLPSKEKVDVAVQEILKNVDKTKLPDGVTTEGLNQAVAGMLYTEYSNGVGLGGKISFDEFVKGLALNSGFQVNEDGKVDVGLTLSYNPSINLGKGWTMTPGAHIGFTPLESFSAGAGVTVDKEWLTKNSTMHKIGVGGEYTEVLHTCHVFTVKLGWSRDKLAGIEANVENKQKEFKEKVTDNLLLNLSSKLTDKKLNLQDNQVLETVKASIKSIVDSLLTSEEKSKFTEEEIKALETNTIRFLSNFDGADLSQEGIRNIISNKMAEQYALAWRHQMLNNIDRKTYLSSASIGFSWVQLGVMGVGILHAGVGVTNHKLDGYDDGSFNTYTDETPEELKGQTEWTQDMLDIFNTKLGLKEGSKIKFHTEWKVVGHKEDETKEEIKEQRNYVEIPASTLKDCTVRINPTMKGLINVDKTNGSVMLSPKTVISGPFKVNGVATHSNEIVIGGGDPNGSERLTSENLGEWATDGEIQEDKLPGREVADFNSLFNETAFNKLKSQVEAENDPIKNVKFDDLILPKGEDGQVQKLQQGQKVVISQIVEGEDKGKFKAEYVNLPEGEKGDSLQIEYKTDHQESLLSPEIADATTKLYAQVATLKTNALNYIKHIKSINAPKGSPLAQLRLDYKNFSTLMKNHNYAEAAKLMVDNGSNAGMLSRMEAYINKMEGSKKMDFSTIKELLQKTEYTDNDKGKVLMSIINMFARVRSVRGNGVDGDKEKYTIARGFGNVFDKERANQIKKVIDRSSTLSDSVKAAYKKLIDKEGAVARANKEKYNQKEVKSGVLQNAIGINLGDPTSVENPLFNPDVYEDFRDEHVDQILDEKEYHDLHEHALEVVAKNPALMSPILKALGLPEDALKDTSKYTLKYENGKLKIDIAGEINKTIELDADLHFGYFAQCVNQMIYLDNVQAHLPGEGASVNFGPSVFAGGSTTEGTKKDNVATTTVRVDVAATAVRHDGSKTETPNPKPDATTTPGEEEGDIPASTTPGKDETQGNGNGTPSTGGEGSTTVSTGEIGNGGGSDSGNGGGETTPSQGEAGQSTHSEGGRD